MNLTVALISLAITPAYSVGTAREGPFQLIHDILNGERPDHARVQCIPQADNDDILARRNVNDLFVPPVSIEVVTAVCIVAPPPVIFVIGSNSKIFYGFTVKTPLSPGESLLP